MSDDMSAKETASGEDNIKFEMDEASTASATDVAEVKPDPDGPDDVTMKEPEGLEEFANGAQGASEIPKEQEAVTEDRKSVKRRASVAFSDEEDNDFKGFDVVQDSNSTEKFTTLLDRMESELAAALDNYKPLRNVTAVPSSVKSKQTSRPDTDGSRPSSGLSSRSDNDGLAYLTDLSPGVKGRRLTIDMSSPLLRVPLERGWKRELVYRAALDSHSRRNADIYYYSPQGKKLRSTREVSENISGTGLTLENFSFFKEPLGINDPEKEIIRDAKVLRRVESPVPTAAPPLDGKRTPKPKPPKGVSPEPAAVPSALKIKVKSLGSRLSSGAQSTPSNNKGKRTDNNNTPTWKKPKPAMAPVASGAPGAIGSPGACGVQGSTHLSPAAPAHPPPPLQSRPQLQHTSPQEQTTRQLVQPCSMSCGRGAVPSLACVACLCLYHPVCVGHSGHAHTFYCKNCRVSPSVEPPPLTHKSGITVSAVVPPLRPRAIRPPVPATTPPAHTLRAPPPTTPPNKRVLLRMKVSGGGPDGERVWAVTKPPGAAGGASPRSLALRPSLPQSIAVLGGRRFIVVPRSLVQTSQQPHDENRRRGRVANGASIAPQPSPSVASPGGGASPRRRGRPRTDDTDHFTGFYNTAKENNYNVVLQIFQYLGMRDLAHCARVCKLWQQLAATPALWRHVRMKNSHVSDWGGLCSALKRNGTKRLDLRKMLLPQNDTVFWEQFAQHIATVDTLERIEMCRCPARAVEAVCSGLHGLKSLSALAIRDALLDPAPLGSLSLLHELRLKSMAGLSLTRDLRPLAALKHLQHLSLTSIKELGWCLCDVVGQLEQLESLELGECTFRAEFGNVLTRLTRLRRLRLERGTAHCAAPALLRALSTLPLLTRLELINFDVKVGFDDALASCKNIQRLLIIPTYVSQSATTNKQVLSGVLRLRDTLTHLMWGVTIELLRVTELFIDQCEQGTGPEDPAANDPKRRDLGECIPVLKPVPGCRLPDDRRHVTGPPQVEILPLPTLQRLLNAQLPNTKLKLLRIPFHATWRQSLADF